MMTQATQLLEWRGNTLFCDGRSVGFVHPSRDRNWPRWASTPDDGLTVWERTEDEARANLERYARNTIITA